MPELTIRPVDRSNWEAALKLEIHPHQHAYTPSVVISLAKCYIRPDEEIVSPFALYHGELIVGFFTFTFDPESQDVYWLNGYLIDKKYQGQGYGRAGLAQLLKLARRIFPRMRSLSLTVNPENTPARRIYEEAGFLNTNRLYHSELVYILKF